MIIPISRVKFIVVLVENSLSVYNDRSIVIFVTVLGSFSRDVRDIVIVPFAVFEVGYKCREYEFLINSVIGVSALIGNSEIYVYGINRILSLNLNAERITVSDKGLGYFDNFFEMI